MARRTPEKKDRTSIIISVVIHVVLIGGVAYWAWKSGKLEMVGRKVLEWVKTEKKQEQKAPPKPIEQKTPPPKLPPINQDAPRQGSGTRRAIASDAPAAAGETFFQDTRKQAAGPSAGGPDVITNAPLKLAAPPPAPRPTLKAAPPSTIKTALKERAQAAASIESFSSEQISRTGVSDAGDIIGKVSGATVVEGKFAVIRGLPERYASASLNGGEIPSADPYRKSPQLDLFPAAMIDRVTVYKTFTPDQPGGFTGGAIDIITKSFPERLRFSLSAGIGYNTEATFNDAFLTYSGGETDWLASDDGKRTEPPQAAAIDNVSTLPTFYPPTAEGEAAVKDYVALQRSFGSRQLGPVSDAAPVNRNFSLALGDSAYFLGHRLGFFGALTYDRKFSFYEDGEQMRYVWPTGHEDEPGQPSVRASLSDTRAFDEISWGGSASLAYELHPGHQLGFNFLYAQNGEDQARRRVGIAGLDNLEKGDTSYLNELHWTERNLNAYQFNGKHTFEELGGVGFDWLYSLANTTQDEPDYRLFNFVQTPQGTINVSGSSGAPEPSGGPTRYFRNLEDDVSTAKVDFTVPFRQWLELDGEFKTGAYLSTSQRDFRERTYTFKPGSDVFGGDPLLFPNTFASDQQLNYRAITNRGGFAGYQTLTSFTDELGNSFLDGEQEIQAFYGMVTLPVSERLRLIGGARYETTDLRVDSFSRLRGQGTGVIDEEDVLPAVGFIYALRTNMSVRFNFAQTVARPTYREFSNLRSYDVTGDEIFVGNTNLVMSHIDNFDLRWEWFPRAGELISVSAFYKEIDKPIERMAIDGFKGDEITYTNFPSAKVYGVEFEARRSLDWLERNLSDFSLGLNVSLIKSESENVESILVTKRQVGFAEDTRPLFDQSPYIITADLTYDNLHTGTTATLAYSVFGERLYLVNNGGADVYEQPAPQFDVIVSQSLNRHWKIKFTAKNLLDPKFERTYGQSGDFDEELIYSTYTKGRTYSFSLSYDF